MRWRVNKIFEVASRVAISKVPVKPVDTIQRSPLPFLLQSLSPAIGFPLFLCLPPALVDSIQHPGWRNSDRPPTQKTLTLCFSSPPTALHTAGEEKPACSQGRQGRAVRGQSTEVQEAREAA